MRTDVPCPGRSSVPPTRRALLRSGANGFGLLALSALLRDRTFAAPPAADSPRPHFAPKARNVIFCFMDGGVSHVDSFDPKPELDRLDGQVHRGNRRWLR